MLYRKSTEKYDTETNIQEERCYTVIHKVGTETNIPYINKKNEMLYRVPHPKIGTKTNINIQRERERDMLYRVQCR